MHIDIKGQAWGEYFYNKKTYINISFDYIDKGICTSTIGKNAEPVYITMQELQAINKKVGELRLEVEKCEYCDKEPKSIFDNRTKMSYKGEFYPGISVYIINNLLNVEAVSDVYEPAYEEAEIEINYCPMCGRKLV